MSDHPEWHQCSSKSFWENIAAGDHVVQLYDRDQVLIGTLTDYAADGFDNDEAVVIIATLCHLKALESQLSLRGFSLEALKAEDRLIMLDADQTLSKFMVNGIPDENYFNRTISNVLKIARKDGRHVRAFGEMVVLLWQRGNAMGTIQLEHLWNKLGTSETFSLLCAYPDSDFQRDAGASITHICTAHSKQIRPVAGMNDQLEYKICI
jgi:hypothetical protein